MDSRTLPRLQDVTSFLKPLSGSFRQGKLTMYGIFRDELFFCSAFFDHYRKLGVEQFVIIDDKSVDGTREFLCCQDDCLALDADLRFGQDIQFLDFSGERLQNRAGIFFKIALPHAYEGDAFSLYCDADEFLALPPGIGSIREVVSRLQSDGQRAALASVVEMFPPHISDLQVPIRTDSFCDLISAYGYFDALPLIRPGGPRHITFVNPSASSRLFERFGVRSAAKGIRGLLGSKPPVRSTPRHKTPVINASPGSHRVNSHDSNVPPSEDVVLTLMHFVFTAQLGDKVARAIRWRSYGNHSDKYFQYADLLARMEARDGRFIGPDSQKFTGADQLISCGLMAW